MTEEEKGREPFGLLKIYKLCFPDSGAPEGQGQREPRLGWEKMGKSDKDQVTASRPDCCMGTGMHTCLVAYS